MNGSTHLGLAQAALVARLGRAQARVLVRHVELARAHVERARERGRHPGAVRGHPAVERVAAERGRERERAVLRVEERRVQRVVRVGVRVRVREVDDGVERRPAVRRRRRREQRAAVGVEVEQLGGVRADGARGRVHELERAPAGPERVLRRRAAARAAGEELVEVLVGRVGAPAPVVVRVPGGREVVLEHAALGVLQRGVDEGVEATEGGGGLRCVHEHARSDLRAGGRVDVHRRRWAVVAALCVFFYIRRM